MGRALTSPSAALYFFSKKVEIVVELLGEVYILSCCCGGEEAGS